MKICIIQPRASYYLAGSEKVSLKHAEFLSKIGHEVNYYTSIPKNKEDTFLFKEFISKKLSGVHISRFDASKSLPDLYQTEPDREHVRWVTESLAFNEKIYDSLKNSRPDIILSYYLPDSLFKPPLIPNVVYLSGYPSQKIPWYKAFIKFCDATISISSVVSAKWKEEIKDVELNYNLSTGVDYPLPLTSKIAPKARFNLLYAGRLIERKGIITLIDAFKKITEKNGTVHLWILGEGELRNSVKRKIKILKLGERVTLTGLVENPYDYLMMADICIFPSHVGDGLMGTVLESMAAGKPVITTTGNGNEDVITHKKNGILIEPKNVDAIVVAINDLFEDESKRMDLGEMAQEFIKENITWEKNCEKLSKILEKIINKFETKSSLS